MRVVIFFIHIPKTAGISINRMLIRNLGSSLIHMPHTFFEPSLKSSSIRSWFSASPDKQGLTSHRLTVDLPLGPQKEFSGFAFAVIREPLEWFLSHFFYTRRQGVVSFSGANSVSTPDEYLDLLASRGKFMSQFRALTGGSCEMPGVKDLVDQGSLALLPQDRLETGLALLHLRFPQLLKDVSMERVNVNTSKAAFDPTLDFRRRFSELFKNDEELYRLATETQDLELARHDSDRVRSLTRLIQLKSRIRSAVISPTQRLVGRLNTAIQRL